jgi:putative transposase
MQIIDWAAENGESIEGTCRALEVSRRAYYRWKKGGMKTAHGGGGGKNKILPSEETRVLALAKENASWRCRKIAYHLEQKATGCIGKTKVAEILKAHGLNQPFEWDPAKLHREPESMLRHEPWRKNYVWGTDWSWVNVNGRFMYLLIVMDWYSRKIVSWSLNWEITQRQVIDVVTDAVATERIDFLPEGALKPFIVADNGSANRGKITRENLKIQGLTLWLSGVGRPTGNARTERTIGTLKWEEIDLQEQYASEEEARAAISTMIHDYNFFRPNAGNGGFAPNAVHHSGRHVLMKKRREARQNQQELRRKHWEQQEARPLI